MHHGILNEKSPLKVKTISILTSKLGTPLPLFEEVQSCIQLIAKHQWTKQVKLVVQKYAIPPANTQLSSLTWFLIQSHLWLMAEHLSQIKVVPILVKGNCKGSTTENRKFPLDNLIMNVGRTQSQQHAQSIISR